MPFLWFKIIRSLEKIRKKKMCTLKNEYENGVNYVNIYTAKNYFYVPLQNQQIENYELTLENTQYSYVGTIYLHT